MTNLTVEPITTLDANQFEAMRQESEALGFRFVTRLINEFADGRNHFDKAGELLLALFADGALIGVGGVNRDPYATEGTVGRVRHVYVLEGERRKNAGTFLLHALIHHAQQHFTLLRLRTMTTEASRFYEKIGFLPVNDRAATHNMELPQ
jgi:GNAT superfamily N-acetyltransferase